MVSTQRVKEFVVDSLVTGRGLSSPPCFPSHLWQKGEKESDTITILITMKDEGKQDKKRREGEAEQELGRLCCLFDDVLGLFSFAAMRVY